LFHSALTLLIILLPLVPAFAHKVSIFAWVENDTVRTESYFPDGKMVKNGKVSVYDSKDNLLLKGVTDEEGLFSFTIPKHDDLTIVLDASMGHRATFVLSAEELEGVGAAAKDDEYAGVGTRHPEDKLSVGRVLCGIGYIVGIMGLIMYFYEKRKRKKSEINAG
jgi:nickel transport protein